MTELFLVLFGLCIGSFMNVVIYRLPLEQSIVKPGSHCTKCNTPLKPLDNIPVLSWIFLGAKCRYCKAKISFQYPLVELFTAFTFWFTYRQFGEFPVYTGFTILFLCIMICLALSDLEHMILPNELTIGGSILYLIYAFIPAESGMGLTMDTLSNSNILKTSWMDGLIAGFGGALAFLLLYVFYLKVRKIEGLGQGDIKMLLLMGAFLGIEKLVIAVLIGSVTGLIAGIVVIIVKKGNLQIQIPYGTFLALGSYISVFWGYEILDLIKSVGL